MIEWWQIGLLFATGLVAGFVDTLAGGGGLLTLPVLLNLKRLAVPSSQVVARRSLSAVLFSPLASSETWRKLST